jgi:hypothetical protein
MSNNPQLSRSEVARLRRAQRTVKELEQTSKRALRPIVPVVSRQAKVSSGLNLMRVESRRRFNIALGLPEIHLHKPIFHLRTGGRPVSLLIALILGVAIYLLLTLPYFHIPSVTVLGNNRLTREEITAVAGVIGQSIFTIQPQEAATRLRMNYPELASVEVNAFLPNHVYVTISERVPVIFWQQGEGYTWIDSQGVAFRPRGLATGLVPVKGTTNPPVGIAPVDDPASPPPFMQKELVDAILALAPSVPANSTMVFDPKDGLGWKDSRGWNVFFGTSVHDMPLKVRVYQSLVDSLVSRGKTPIFISVVYPDAPFYRMAETTPEEATTATADSGN